MGIGRLVFGLGALGFGLGSLSTTQAPSPKTKDQRPKAQGQCPTWNLFRVAVSNLPCKLPRPDGTGNKRTLIFGFAISGTSLLEKFAIRTSQFAFEREDTDV